MRVLPRAPPRSGARAASKRPMTVGEQPEIALDRSPAGREDDLHEAVGERREQVVQPRRRVRRRASAAHVSAMQRRRQRPVPVAREAGEVAAGEQLEARAPRHRPARSRPPRTPAPRARRRSPTPPSSSERMAGSSSAIRPCWRRSVKSIDASELRSRDRPARGRREVERLAREPLGRRPRRPRDAQTRLASRAPGAAAAAVAARAPAATARA